MCFDLSNNNLMLWSDSIGSYTNSTIVREPWQDFSGLLFVGVQPLIIVWILVFLILIWIISFLTSKCNWICKIIGQISLLCDVDNSTEWFRTHQKSTGYLYPKCLMHICTKISGPSVANCEVPGSLNWFKIIHNNLTNPYYLMLKQEGSREYTFGVKNIQKSELRPLHKFEQDLDLLAAKMCLLVMGYQQPGSASP